MKLSYSIGTDSEVEKIHEDSLRILEKVGAVMHYDPAVELFKSHGAKVDGNIVYIPKKMVTNALKTLPPRYDWYDRDGGKITIGDKKMNNAPAYGPIYVLKEGKYERANHEHFVNFHKLYETSPVVQISSPNTMDVSYVPAREREMYRLGVTLKYCKKPVMGVVDGGMDVVKKGLQKMQEFYGIKDKVITTGLIATMGPMQMSYDMCEAVMAYAEFGQALIMTSGVMVGGSGPQTMAGSYVLGNSMILAGIVLSQLVNPGTPVIYCGRFSGADMRYSAPAYGGIESMLACATSRRMADYYKMPLQSGNSNTESKLLDYQSGAESFMNLLNGYLLHVDCMLHTCGVLDSMNSIGYEKFMLDEETAMSLEHLMKGFEVTDEMVMFDQVMAKGPTGSYFGRTLPAYHNNFFSPKLAIRDNHNSWLESGSPSGESLATEAWKKRLEEYEMPEVTKERESILKELIPQEYWNEF